MTARGSSAGWWKRPVSIATPPRRRARASCSTAERLSGRDAAPVRDPARYTAQVRLVGGAEATPEVGLLDPGDPPVRRPGGNAGEQQEDARRPPQRQAHEGDDDAG